MQKIDWGNVGKGTMASVALLSLLTVTFEGTILHTYRDPVGIWTDCTGNTHDVPQVREVLTEEYCQGVDAVNKKAAFTALDREVKVSLNQNERAAFADFIFNEGEGTFSRSSMKARLRRKDYVGACTALFYYEGAFVHGRYVKLPGLIKRRKAEYQICLTPQKD